jgi:hypothetical protein
MITRHQAPKSLAQEAFILRGLPLLLRQEQEVDRRSRLGHKAGCADDSDDLMKHDLRVENVSRVQVERNIFNVETVHDAAPASLRADLVGLHYSG